jgi:hypothetical protein
MACVSSEAKTVLAFRHLYLRVPVIGMLGLVDGQESAVLAV